MGYYHDCMHIVNKLCFHNLFMILILSQLQGTTEEVEILAATKNLAT